MEKTLLEITIEVSNSYELSEERDNDIRRLLIEIRDLNLHSYPLTAQGKNPSGTKGINEQIEVIVVNVHPESVSTLIEALYKWSLKKVSRSLKTRIKEEINLYEIEISNSMSLTDFNEKLNDIVKIIREK